MYLYYYFYRHHEINKILDMIELIRRTLNDIRNAKPLVVNFTNFVTMDFMANTLLALGAAPIMSCCLDEVEELVNFASAININIGTLNEDFMKIAHAAAQFARENNKPVIFDPVGVGATRIRTKSALELLPYASIIRGNASEIIAISGSSVNAKGVETTNSTDEAKSSAIILAKQLGCTVIVSGKVDFITNGDKQVEVPYGSELMTFVTGMGCTMTSVVAAFRAVINDSFQAANVATHYYDLIGELTSKSVQHPGSFRTEFIDNIHESNFEKLKAVI